MNDFPSYPRNPNQGYNYPDPMLDFLLSGKAHVYYGLMASIGIIGAVVLWGASFAWLYAVALILGFIFADLYWHWYAH
jgi:hypothetical protein